MSASAVPAARESVQQALARDRLGLPSVLYFALSSVAPLTVAAGLVTTAFAVTGLTAVPAAFVVVAIVLVVFSVGYVAMARQTPVTATLYGFVARGLGRPVGVAAAAVALVAYNLLQISLFGAIGVTGSALAASRLGIHAQWWVWALVVWALVGILGAARIDLSGRVLAVLGTAEIVVILILAVSAFTHPASGGISLAPLNPTGLLHGGAAALIVIAVLGFIGFETPPVYGGETRDPRRTVPLAVYSTLGGIAVVYIAAGMALLAAYGPTHTGAVSGQLGPAALFGLARTPWLATTAQVLFLTSLTAAAISFHAAAGRYFFTLGREGALPASLGRVARTGSPRIASLTQSMLALGAIIGYALAHLDPMVQGFYYGGTTGGFGVLLLATATSLAVHRHPGTKAEGVWRSQIAPAAATIMLTALAVAALAHYDTLLGVASTSPLTWLLPGSYAVAAAAGLAWAAALRRSRPHSYQVIGLGTEPTAVPQTTAVAP